MAKLEQTEIDGVKLLKLSGSLTQAGTERLVPAFDAATPGTARVVVDLSGVDLLATTGLAMLLSAARRVRDGGGRLIVTGTCGTIRDVIHRCRLDMVLTVVPSPDEAFERARACTA